MDANVVSCIGELFVCPFHQLVVYAYLFLCGVSLSVQ